MINIERRKPLLQLNNITIEIDHRGQTVTPVESVCFSLEQGETLALVGESGSGKSMTALTIMDLLPRKARIVSGEIVFDGQVVAPGAKDLRRQLRGREIAMIFQEPVAALNPVFTIGTQISDIIRRHSGMNIIEAHDFAIDLFRQVGLTDPRFVYHAYPHQLSGGMAQRCMIAMALSCRPRLIIADEPTTALDVTTQQQILSLIAHLQQKHNFALLLISHDLKVVSRLADRIAVMQAGKILEMKETGTLLNAPESDYTATLIAAYYRLSERKSEQKNFVETQTICDEG